MKMTDRDYTAFSNMLDNCATMTTESIESTERARWDMLWSVPPATVGPFLSKLYKYLNDSHIDTALRRYVASKVNV